MKLRSMYKIFLTAELLKDMGITFSMKQGILLWLQFSLSQSLSHNQIPANMSVFEIWISFGKV